MFAISCKGITLTILIVYVASLGMFIYQTIFPTPCQYLQKKDQNLKNLCLSPMWKGDEKIDIHLYLGKTKQNTLGNSIWSIFNHSVDQKFTDRIEFPLPSFLSDTDDNVLKGFLKFSPSIKGSLNTMDVIFSFNLVMSRNSRNGANESRKKLHWKFLNHPIIIRFANVQEILEQSVYERVFLTKPIKRKSDIINGARYLYEPLLWLDDLSITSRHYSPVFPSSKLNTSQDSNIKNISIELQFVPTFPLYLVVKRVIQHNIDLITSIVSSSSSGVMPVMVQVDSFEVMIDELRYFLSEDKLYVLFVTQIIAWLHIAFQYLAFRNDYQFFYKQNNFIGISISSMIMSLVRSIIMFLYLLDADASWLILGGIVKDIIYDSWKLSRILHPSWKTTDLKTSTLLVAAKGSESDVNSLEDEVKSSSSKLASLANDHIGIDAQANAHAKANSNCRYYDYVAMLHGGLCMGPLVLGVGLYGFVHKTHKSTYSWILSSLVDSIYFFSFLTLLPQLYINYKLKSVAHLPIRSFAYKIFNTFVDDIFAFVIKSPLKYKLMTLRDDVIFVGFIYQWYIYPSDMKRPNEFGFQYENTVEKKVKSLDDVKEEKVVCANSNEAKLLGA